MKVKVEMTAVDALKSARTNLQAEIGKIEQALVILNGHKHNKPKSYTRSAAERKRIGAGVRRAHREKQQSLTAKARKA